MAQPPRPPNEPDTAASPPADVAEPPTPAPWRTPTVLAVVGVLALLALVVVVLQRDPVRLSTDTPEGTVQAWLQSMADDEPATGLLAEVDCGLPPDHELRFDGALRAVVVESTTEGDRATIEVAITETQGGLFDDGWTYDATYELQRSGDGWLITGFDWPWSPCWNDAVIPGGAS